MKLRLRYPLMAGMIVLGAHAMPISQSKPSISPERLHALEESIEIVHVPADFRSDYAILDKYNLAGTNAYGNMMQESALRFKLRSSKGAHGPSQLMRHTPQELQRRLRLYRRGKLGSAFATMFDADPQELDAAYENPVKATKELLKHYPATFKYRYDCIKGLESCVRKNPYANHKVGCAIWGFYEIDGLFLCKKYNVPHSPDVTPAIYNSGLGNVALRMRLYGDAWNQHLLEETETHVTNTQGYSLLLARK